MICSEGAIAEDDPVWWSLQPLATASLPPAEGIPPHGNPVDAFVLKRLHTAGLAPSRRASRRVLARRLAFDLLGLPPA